MFRCKINHFAFPGLNSWKLRFCVLFLSVVCGASVFYGSDRIEGLIDDEKNEMAEWMGSGEDIPPVYLLGDKTGIEIFSDAMDPGNPNLLCHSLVLDELIELSGGKLGDRETILNISLSRVRDVVGESCLVRPNDIFIAIGKGWQKRVSGKDYVIKPDRPVCSTYSPYSLWMSLEAKLDAAPLFYSSDLDITEDANHFKGIEDYEKIVVDAQVKEMLKGTAEFVEEFDIEGFQIDSLNCGQLWILKRKTVSLDDLDLPNEEILWQKGDQIAVMEIERVDHAHVSGHLSIGGVLDFNHDGFVDIIIEGTQRGCHYQLLFIGIENGFKQIPFPTKACGC